MASRRPHLHFSRDELSGRQERVRGRMAELGYDGLLLFKMEDMYWLSGYDSEGFVIFDCMFIGVAGELTHVTRRADLANIRYSSVCDDIRIWEDREGNPKSRAIKDMLDGHGLQGRRIGVQVDAMGISPRLHGELRAELDGWCDLVDAPDFIRRLRLVKSPQELDYLRAAGRILDEAARAAVDAIHAGVDEGELFAAIYATILRRGGDMPAHRILLGSGDAAMNVRYTTGRRAVPANDQVTFELGCGYRHYHAADMFVVLTGPVVDERHRRMHAACAKALGDVQGIPRPGTTLGEVFDMHRAAFARAGTSTRSCSCAATRWAPPGRPAGWSSRRST